MTDVVSSEEQKVINEMFTAYDKLRQMGWQDGVYAPKDGKLFWSIEAGSTGVFKTQYFDGVGFFSTDEEDSYPTNPILWKSLDAGPLAVPEPDPEREAYIKTFLQRLSVVRPAIQADIETNGWQNQSVSNAIPCPVCETGTVNYTYAGKVNGHISARCSTEGCVQWME